MPPLAPPLFDAPDQPTRWPTAAAHAAGTLVLVLATWLVYQPCLAHVPRWDHWWFLREASQYDGLPSLLRHTYSYNRTSTFGRGDCELFRPVLFALLATEQAAFGSNFPAWQRCGLLLHLAVVLLLLLLLLRLRLWLAPDARSSFCPLAFALALFFSLNISLAEAVMWTHIQGYVLFVGVALAAVHLAWPELRSARAAHPGPRLAAAWALLALAAFTHEVGQFFAVAFGLALALAYLRAGRGHLALAVLAAFALLLPVYQAANRLDLARHGPLPTHSPWDLVLAAARQPGLTAFNVLRYVLYTLVQPFFPSTLHWSYFGRVVINEPVENRAAYLRPGPLLALSYATLGVLLAAALATLPRLLRTRPGRALAALLGLLASLAGLQTLVNVLGRLNLRPGSGQLVSSPYYCYLPLACLLPALYALWLFGRSRRDLRARLSPPLLAALAVLTAATARHTHEVAHVLRDHHRPVRAATRDIRRTLAQHRHDPDFRFSFDPPVYAALHQDRGVPFPEILFPRRLDHRRPTVVFVLEGNTLVARPLADYCRATGRSPARPLPELAGLDPREPLASR